MNLKVAVSGESTTAGRRTTVIFKQLTGGDVVHAALVSKQMRKKPMEQAMSD